MKGLKLEDNFVCLPGKVIKGDLNKFVMEYDYDGEKISMMVRNTDKCEVIGDFGIGNVAVVSGYYDQILIIGIPAGKNKKNNNVLSEKNINKGKMFPVIDAKRIRFFKRELREVNEVNGGENQCK